MSFNENATRDALIQNWQAAQSELAAAKDKESALRAEVIATLFAEHPDKGPVNYELGGGYKVKAVFKQNYRLAGSDEVDAVLSKIENSGPEGEFIAKRLVKWKPELAITEYNVLEPKFKKIIDNVLTISAATPTVELVIPKAKK